MSQEIKNCINTISGLEMQNQHLFCLLVRETNSGDSNDWVTHLRYNEYQENFKQLYEQYDKLTQLEKIISADNT